MKLTSKALLPHNRPVKQLMFFAHGYGSNADDLLGLTNTYKRHFPDMGFISVNAPLPIYQDGYAWFELDSLAPETFKALPYLENLVKRAQEPAHAFLDFINQMMQKFSLEPKDVILTGFSQGSLISLYTALLTPTAFKGVIAFSAVPLLTNEFKQHTPFPVLLTHGKEDTVIDPMAVALTVAQLKQIGLNPEVFWQQKMGHAINEACLNHSISFLKKI